LRQIDSCQKFEATPTPSQLTLISKNGTETHVLRTIEYEKCLATLLIMLSPFAPHFAAECWKGFADHAIGSQEYINKSILEQKWPTIDQSFNNVIKFIYIDEKGKFNESHTLEVDKHLLANWTQEDITKVINYKEDIEKIEIIKDVVVFITLKNCLQTK
jgi:leucyl-tRNA synthetase